MAKHKGSKNVTKPAEELVESVEAAVDVLVEDAQEEAEEAKVEPVPVIAVVTNCGSLRVRRWPNAEEEIIAMLNKGDQVELDVEDAVVDGWYKVILPNTNERGFCMKDYLVIQ